MLGLDIGSGIRPVTAEGWETMDERDNIRLPGGETYKPNIVGDILSGIPRPDGYYNKVRASSFLEHFARREYRFVIKECCRVLSPGGNLWVSVPDMALLSKAILKGEKLEKVLTFIYGEQNYPGNFHKWGYTAGELNMVLLEVGFKKTVVLKPKQYAYELVMEATK